MSRSFAVIFVLLLLVAVGVLYTVAPGMFASAVPGYLNTNIGSFLVIDQSDFSRSPPELILKGIHLKNPGEFGTGDALTIEQANVVFNSYSHDPYDIKSITLHNVAGKKIYRGDKDNLTAVHSLLMDRKYQTPRGEMARPVNLGNFIILHSTVSDEKGNVVTPLPDKNLTPNGAMSDNPPLQSVVTDILGAVIEQQQAGAGDIAIQNMADKATETIKEIGTSLKSFLNSK